VRSKYNLNHFNFQNIPFIILHKFCARPAWYCKNETKIQFDFFFFFFLCPESLKQKPFVMTEGCLYEFWTNTEKPEKLLYLN